MALTEPDEEEKYLYAILDSPDGIEMAEAFFCDQSSPDGRYRLRDYQWSWFTCEDPQQIDQGGRSVGKTEGIKLRQCAHPFVFPGMGSLITAPQLNHLRPLVDAVEAMILTNRIVREMTPAGRVHGIARQPGWQIRFRNGSTIVSRLPGLNGTGVKGNHVVSLTIDESQDYPKAGWTEVAPTLERGLPGASWHCHGVSTGVRNSFWEKTQPGSGWTVHRPMAMMRGTWGDQERNDQITEAGGSRQNVDYKRNIYGEHGSASQHVIVLARLMAVTDENPDSHYNTNVYRAIRLEFEALPTEVDERRVAMLSMLDFPGSHLHGYSEKTPRGREVGSPRGYEAYWAGMDIGVTVHPSELLAYGQRTGEDFLELLLRIQMHRIECADQAWIVEQVFDFYGERLQFGIDSTGVGFGVWQPLSHMSFGDRVHAFNFSEKRIAGFERRELKPGETMGDLAVHRLMLESSTDWLRNDYIDAGRMKLPNDRELLQEHAGQTYTVVRSAGDPYGTRRTFGGGSLHTLDAAKIMVAARRIPEMEARAELAPQEDVADVFLDGVW